MMRRWILPLLAATSLWSASYREVVGHISRTPALQSAELMSQAAREEEAAAQGRNLPSLDLSLQSAWLKETPTMTLHTGFGPSGPLPMGRTRNFIGALTLSYPLFTGFAVSASIDRARWQAERARLKTLDLKRNLILKATELYGVVEAYGRILRAQQKAKSAILAALKKAQGLYKNGLIPPADLYNIRAKAYEIDARITQTRSTRQQMLRSLAYLSGLPMHGIEGGISLPPLPGRAHAKRMAWSRRVDLRALQSALHMDEAQIRLAESRYYPTVGVRAALKRHGDTLALNGDGFTNADQSYAGIEVNWNLFNGEQDRHHVEAARYKRLASASALVDYRERVATEIDNAYLELSALRAKRKSAAMQVRAQEEYYKLTEGRFANQLASADELSRSIASLADARAKAAVIATKIRVQEAKIWLLTGVENFEKEVKAR